MCQEQGRVRFVPGLPCLPDNARAGRQLAVAVRGGGGGSPTACLLHAVVGWRLSRLTGGRSEAVQSATTPICIMDLSHLVCVRAAAEFCLSSSFAFRGGFFFFRWRAQCFFVLAALPVEALAILFVGAEDWSVSVGPWDPDWLGYLDSCQATRDNGGFEVDSGLRPAVKTKGSTGARAWCIYLCFFLSRLTRDCE